MRWLVLSGVVVAAVLSGSGCLQKSEPSKRETVSHTGQAIQGGATDNTDKFALGVCDGPAGQCYGICSGALILPNVVATARHCVSDTPDKINCAANPQFGAARSDTFSVTTNTTMDPANSGWYSVKSVAVPDDDHICGNDIALLILSKSIPAATATPITPGVQYLMWDPVPNYLMTYSAIGYGATSASSGDGSGTRRVLNGIDVLCIPGSPWFPCPKDFNANEFVGGDGTCHGDSGSSAYESNLYAKGTPLSFGVLSRGDDTGGTCGTAIYSRFDVHRDFILKTAKQASNNWTLYPEPSWTEEKPLAVAPDDPETSGKKDAGTSDKETTLSKLGESCTHSDDCKSGKCVEQEDETKVCSQDCEDTDGCPDGFECRESLCLPQLAGGDEETPDDDKSSTKSGCAVGSPAQPGTSGVMAGLTAMAVFAFSAARRRRRAG